MEFISQSLKERLPQAILLQIKQTIELIEKSMETMRPSNRILKIPDNYLSGDKHVIFAIGKNSYHHALSLYKRLEGKDVTVIVHQAEGYVNQEIENKNEFLTKFVLLPHPYPNETTFSETEHSLSIIKEFDENSTLHFIVTGGGSATFALPETGILPEDYIQITKEIIAGGFNIHEINYSRTLIDKVKGGKFRKYLNFGKVNTWISSDVVGDDPRVVASGPTVPGIESSDEINKWLHSYLEQINVDITTLENRLENTMNKFDEKNQIFHTQLLTSRKDLLNNIVGIFEEEGRNVKVMAPNINTSLEKTAEQMIDEIRNYQDNNTTLIWSGEPLVTIQKDKMERGRGGRISSLCCLVAEKLVDLDKNVVFIGVATDGKDGSSPDPGYIVTRETAAHLRPLGGSQRVIRGGNSGHILSSLGYGIQLSSTHNNLLDLYFAIVF